MNTKILDLVESRINDMIEDEVRNLVIVGDLVESSKGYLSFEDDFGFVEIDVIYDYDVKTTYDDDCHSYHDKGKVYIKYLDAYLDGEVELDTTNWIKEVTI